LLDRMQLDFLVYSINSFGSCGIFETGGLVI
jgi:hypothetical protein